MKYFKTTLISVFLFIVIMSGCKEYSLMINELPKDNVHINESNNYSYTDSAASNLDICENNSCILNISNNTEIDQHNFSKEYVVTANPASLYATDMGCRHKLITGKQGGQIGICILPDGKECTEWDFYRGKCGQEWSYCKQHGYDVKNLSQNEGWMKGGICLDKNRMEIGNVYDLMKLGQDEENYTENDNNITRIDGPPVGAIP
jgi:putative hemolysin